MSRLLIVADLGSLGEAAGSLGASLSRAPARSGLPSFGAPEADDAAAGFVDALHGHSQRLSGAAAAGVRCLHGFACGFREISRT